MKLQGKKPKDSLPRREPATIHDSDDPSDDDNLAPRPKAHTRKTNAVVISNDEAEDDQDSEADEKPESDEDEGNLELEKLNAKALKNKLWLERVQWAAKSEDEDEDDGSNIDMPKADLELTTASEGDFFPGGGNDNSSDEELLSSAYRKKISKRGLDRRGEVPQWKHSNKNEKNEKNLEKVKDEDVNKDWRYATYVSAQSGCLISILAQPSELQTIIRAAIHRVTGDIIFENAYVSSDDVISYNRKILGAVVVELEEDHYAMCFKDDHNFGVVVGRVLNGCVSNFRGNLKKIALSKVEGFYHLIGPDCNVKIEQLIRQMSYIFPRKDDGTLIKWTKPFHHLAIIATLRQVLDEGKGA